MDWIELNELNVVRPPCRSRKELLTIEMVAVLCKARWSKVPGLPLKQVGRDGLITVVYLGGLFTSYVSEYVRNVAVFWFFW